jgi:hypothetical protein
MKLAYLSICAIFKDEAPYLPERIEFHRLVGVERFFLYDNLRVDGGREVLEPWVRARVVRAWKRRMRRGLAQLPLIETDPYAVRQSSVKRVSVERLRLNHYAVCSRHEFEQKTARHGSSRLAPRYFSYHDRNEVHDPALVPYAGKVRAQLAAIEARP